MNCVEGMIKVKSANENNLKGISVKIPIGKFTAVTGPSGSGKSSLVYDTIYAESQRCFAESFDINIRELPRPHVGSIENLRPALAVSQLSYNKNPRSTVGTVSDISYLLRTLYALAYEHETGSLICDDEFSPNSSRGCCRSCMGTGVEKAIDLQKIIPNQNRCLKEGAISIFCTGKDGMEAALLHAYCVAHKINESLPLLKLPPEHLKLLEYADGTEMYHVSYKTYNGKRRSRSHPFVGAVRLIEREMSVIDKPSVAQRIGPYLRDVPCHVCKGTRLGSIGSRFRLCGKTIAEIESMDIVSMETWIQLCKGYCAHSRSMLDLCDGILRRTSTLKDLCLSYLTLNRSMPSLSGGEMQRVRIAVQVTCPLAGLVYILDEPCKGLHPIDVQAVVSAIKVLKDKGNTVITIEHNQECIQSADRVISLGPVGGPDGGFVVSRKLESSNYRAIIDRFSEERNRIKFATKWTKGPHVRFLDVRYNNLTLKEVVVPTNGIVAITGVSGSGKSSLMRVVEQSVNAGHPWHCKSVFNNSKATRLEMVDQSPIGKSSRSIVASYLTVYDDIRMLYASTDSSMKQKLSATDFSVNVSGGRCETCHGTGVVALNMPYASDSYIQCPACLGRRFSEKVLSVKCNGLNINDLLNRDIASVYNEYKDNDCIRRKLSMLLDLGLGYLRLGQPTQKLSGGESQRLKLARILGVASSRDVVYLLDEPSSGLSFDDCEKLAAVLFKVASQSAGLVVVEHNFLFVRTLTDSIIDLGRFPGAVGGKKCVSGAISEVAKNKESSWYGFKAT